ncbi:hypothetical protein [Streptomyces sp. Tue6028]|uniref:hypothetical protein n=1 Tax=Streptomyces sp. Tue6028 TaxID=2036037 RepID=UPI003D707775
MSRTPFRPDRPEYEAAGRELPVPAERDLPTDRHTVLKGFLMNEIRMDAAEEAPGSAGIAVGAPLTVRLPRRRTVRLGLSLVATALAGIAVAGLSAGSASHTARVHSGASPDRIVTAAYTLEHTHSGKVELTVIDPGGTIHADRLQRQLSSFGVPATVTAHHSRCKVTTDRRLPTARGLPTAGGAGVPAKDEFSELNDLHPAASFVDKHGRTVLDVWPSRIPKGQQLSLTFLCIAGKPHNQNNLIVYGLKAR